MAVPTCAFPLFRERFLQPLQEGNAPPAGLGALAACPGPQGACLDPQLSPTKAASRMGNLRVLDLRALPRDDGPPTELRARKEKLAHFERQCSRVAEGLYVGAEHVAKSRESLRQAGITHVVNCVGFLYPPYFEDELQYKVLYLQDTPGEDMLCILYDVFDFIEAAAAAPGGSGRVLVHCSQGVSRSATLAIAYLMWKQAACYDDVFQAVKAARGVTNPNIGFICQLLQWHKRRHAPVHACRLYRITPQSPSAGQYLVAKSVGSPRGASLDPRGAFVLQGPASLSVWVGSACPQPFVEAAQRFAAQLQKYEGAAEGPATLVQQGQEPPAFWACLAAAAAASEGSGSRAGSPAAPGTAGAVAAAAAAEALAAVVASGEQVAVVENSVYDKDYALYARSLLSSRGSGGDSGDSARSGSGGRKTPREEGDDGDGAGGSPNDRLRKQARGVERPPSPGKRRREPPGDLTLEDLQPGISMDSAAAQLGKKERTLQEATSPPLLGRTTSEHMDGSMTSRSRGSEEQHWQQQAQSQQQQPKGRQRQASNLGRPAAAPGEATSGGSSGGGGSRRVPPINLRLALPGR